MITEATTQQLFEFDELIASAQAHARETNEMLFWMSYDIDEQINNVLWGIEEFNETVGHVLRVYNAHGAGTETVEACEVNFFDTVEMCADAESPSCPEIAEAYNDAYNSIHEQLSNLLERIEDENEASDNVPIGEHDWHIYEVLSLQDQYADLVNEAIRKAAEAANDAIESARDMYSDEYEFSELARSFYFTESGDYVRAI